MAAYIPARTKVISEKQRLHRIGAAMTQNFPWDGIMSNQAKTWIQTVAGAHNTEAEYVFLSSLAAIAALAGPQTRVTIHEHTYEEKLNTFMCILGDAGASMYYYICSFSPASSAFATSGIVSNEFEYGETRSVNVKSIYWCQL